MFIQNPLNPLFHTKSIKLTLDSTWAISFSTFRLFLT
jgi:hypothetical protein